MSKSYLTTEWYDQETGAKGYLVIDELKDGFCAGGIRMAEGVTKEEVERLAEIMTLKMAGLGMSIGGAKGGIDFPSNDPESKAVLKRYLAAHLPYLLHYWLTSEDMGTREEDIAALLQELGMSSTVQAYIMKQDNKEELIARLQKAMTATYDGMKMTDLVTGYGIAVVTMQGLRHLNKQVEGAKVAIQGFGSVGASAAKFLSENNVKVVAVADIHGTIYCEAGLDVTLLLEKKDPKGNISREGLPEEYEQLSGDAWLKKEVEVLIPAAIPDAIHKNNVQDVNASLIVEGGNIPVTKEAEEMLYERNIFVIPDFIANSGGAGLFVSVLDGKVTGEPEEVFQFLKEQLGGTTEEIMSIAKKENIFPREAARKLL